jgi:hypothetical protein
MDHSWLWFGGLAAGNLAGLLLGYWLGRGPRRQAWITVCGGLLLLLAWVALLRHPAAAVQTVPLRWLTYMEGPTAAPFFAICIGAAWSLCRRRRQRLLVAIALALGATQFVQGGWWMLQATPAHAFGRSIRDQPVLQSQAYSCVPAACATALHDLGVPASEQEMADLTHTRPQHGATLLRAMDGLTRRLAGCRWRPLVLEPQIDDLRWLPSPVVTSLRLGPAQRHMVVVERVDRTGVCIADPVAGISWLPRDEFAAQYTGEVIVFVRR